MNHFLCLFTAPGAHAACPRVVAGDLQASLPPAILALHATCRPSRQMSSRLEASPLSSTFVAFSIRSPPFLELRRSRARAAHRRALRRPPLTVLPPICCALGRLASPRTCSTPPRAGPSPCSRARGAAAPLLPWRPLSGRPNPVRTHQWVALDLLVLIHPSLVAGKHPHRRNRRFPLLLASTRD